MTPEIAILLALKEKRTSNKLYFAASEIKKSVGEKLSKDIFEDSKKLLIEEGYIITNKIGKQMIEYSLNPGSPDFEFVKNIKDILLRFNELESRLLPTHKQFKKLRRFYRGEVKKIEERLSIEHMDEVLKCLKTQNQMFYLSSLGVIKKTDQRYLEEQIEWTKSIIQKSDSVIGMMINPESARALRLSIMREIGIPILPVSK